MGQLIISLASVIAVWLYFIFAACIIFLPILYIANDQYKKTEYYNITHNQFLRVHFDKGLYGEYLTYKNLRPIHGTRKFLFNIYLPKGNGETAEIDVLLVHESGLYVFESKNYSGWIFGTENQRQWTQTLPSGRKSTKSHFLNPIMQNELHIRCLRTLLADYPKISYHSLILFSDRCELKKIELTEQKAEVIHRQSVLKHVENKVEQTGEVLTGKQIQEIYERLYPFSQVSEEVKQKHIEDIESNKSKVSETPELKPRPQKLITDETLQAKNANVIEQSGETIKVCLLCGRPMVLRTAARGKRAGKQFWGCSGYPHCSYIINLEDASKKELV